MESATTRVAVEKEIEKAENQVRSFDSIIDAIDKRRYKIHHIDDFRQLVLHCKQLLKKDLAKKLRFAIEDLEPKDQVKELDKFRGMMRKLAERLYDITVNSLEIPYELYFLCDNFLEYYETRPHYIIFVSDEIALTPFTFILQNIGKFEEEYFFREFWNEISKEKFYFVQIVSDLAGRDSSLDWPVILHEIGHVVCSERGIDDKYFKGTSIYDALITMLSLTKNTLSPTNAGIISAVRKLYASELLSDYLVTRCYGPIFGWRFARKWVDFRDVFEPSRTLETHPEPKIRLERVINEVKMNLRMPELAEFLENESTALYGLPTRQEEKKEIIGIDIDTLIKDVEKAITPIKNEVGKYSKFILTQERVRESISASMWSKISINRKGAQRRLTSPSPKLLKKIASDLLKGKPIVVDPPIIYYLLIVNSMQSSRKLKKLEEKTENAKMLREFIADLVRLYHVQSQFKQIKRTKQTLEKELDRLTKKGIQLR